jgi:hypothetical protein
LPKVYFPQTPFLQKQLYLRMIVGFGFEFWIFFKKYFPGIVDECLGEAFVIKERISDLFEEEHKLKNRLR